jgi:streptomycin 6-kinase
VSGPHRVPAGLGWWRSQPGGAEWLERLPRLVAECAERWELRPGEPFEPSSVAYVAPVALPGGAPAVLKVGFPDRESEHEPAALAHWAGEGAVRLLDDDPARRALLLDRCEPGAPLWAVADEAEANAIAAAILRRLWRAPAPGAPFRPRAGEARRWADELPGRWARHGRPFERALLDAAVGWVAELVAAPGPDVVLHQDLHGGNVLRAGRERWLAIDPKPLTGEREFDVASLLRDRRAELAADPAPARRVRRRLDQLAAELDLDRERARRWGVIHALAWGVAEDAVFPEILACAGWLATV